MANEQFCSLLILLVPEIISEIAKNENISAETATEQFYCSQLYADLENEQTKLWHLSPKALCELYHQEKSTGTIIYPEEA